MSKVDWKTDLEYSKDGVCRIHEHDLGFNICRGWNANDPESPKTFRFVITERDKYGIVKPYYVKDFDTGKLRKLQIILPDDVKFLRAFSDFVLAFAKNLEEGMAAEAFQSLFENKEGTSYVIGEV